MSKNISDMTPEEIQSELDGYSLERHLLALKRRREKILERGAELRDGDKHQVNADLREIDRQIKSVEFQIMERDGECPIQSCEVEFK